MPRNARASAVAIGLLLFPAVAAAQESVPNDFEGPRLLETEELRIQPPTVNLVDPGWHQNELQHRSSLACAVMEPDEERELGRIRIYPARKPAYDAEVHRRVLASANGRGLEPVLAEVLKRWIRDVWPSESAAYPGREISRGGGPPCQNCDPTPPPG